LETRESEKQRISFQHSQVPQARAADQQHAHQRQGDAERPIVAIELANRKHLLEAFGEARPIQEAPEQLDSAVRAELLMEASQAEGGEISNDYPLVSSIVAYLLVHQSRKNASSAHSTRRQLKSFKTTSAHASHRKRR
jgi:hypothetical protein